MTKEKLDIILEKHKKWLNNEPDGEKACLGYEDLSGMDLSDVDLSNADLNHVDLTNAILRDASLSRADLWGANLEGADLSGAGLFAANLSYANLTHTKLFGVWLDGANLAMTQLDEEEKYRKGIILKRKIIGYKKCRDNKLVTLEIPKGAIVFCVNGDHCRTNIAKVLEIIDETDNKCETAVSMHFSKFIYKIGKKYIIDDFDLDYREPGTTGIHFFKTKQQAEEVKDAATLIIKKINALTRHYLKEGKN